MTHSRRSFLQTLQAAALAAAPIPSTPAISSFFTPPPQSRPWLYWFWKNGNIRQDAISADLEAMARAGIGGFILMEVSLSTPKGPVAFFSPHWRALLRHAISEAARLNLLVSVSSAPGWTGSGGPWVTPAQSMQKVTSSETLVTGPQRFDSILPQPDTVRGFYSDIAVLAFPTPPQPARTADIEEKALYERGPYSSKPGIRPAFPPVSHFPSLAPAQLIPQDRILDISAHMDPSGRLSWDVPPGNWTIARYGHTSTGQTNRPSPLEGLECDKLDKSALDQHYRQFTAQLIADAGPLAGKTLVATHLDSWEVGAQNWSPTFRLEFQRRRGYDPLPWLPAFRGSVIGSSELTERFLWDLRQTVCETIAENHGRHMRQLAKESGIWLSIEPYDMNPGDDMTLGAAADVPMCEFWSGHFDARYSVKEATSVAHVYGRPLVAAEALTSGAQDCWKLHPAAVKRYGDWAFSQGVNRFVIHRSVHQPFPQIRPGLTLSTHGLHCERTQTWWALSRPWHTYLARCQILLQHGRFLADVLYLSPEGAPNVFQPPRPEPSGYKYDACTPDALLRLAQVRNGRVVFPSGAAYRLLVLPLSSTMTPALLNKINQLAQAGATVIGEPPTHSPSLSGYPRCDEEVRRLAAALRPKLLSGPDYTPIPQQGESGPAILHAARIGPAARFARTFTLPAAPRSAELRLTASAPIDLGVNGSPLTPRRIEMMLDRNGNDGFRQVLVFDLKRALRTGSNELVVSAAEPVDLAGVLCLRDRSGAESFIPTDASWSAPVIGPLGIPPNLSPLQSDLYAPSTAIESLLAQKGLPPDFTADRPLRFCHRRTADSDTYFVSNAERRTFNATCTFRVSGRAPELWHPETGEIRPLPQYSEAAGRTTIPLRFESEESYFVVFRQPPAGNNAGWKNFATPKTVAEISGPWQVTFDPHWGGPPAPVLFDKLTDWTARPEEGIRHYSGTAIYQTTFSGPGIPARRFWLELGAVHEFAEVLVNGHHCGLQWRRPFRFEVGHALRPGNNRLEVRVTNLWPNRMIGDQHLPEDAEWVKNRLARWPDWVLNGERSPTGRYTFTHVRPYKKDSPLLPSGLLGPVRLRLLGYYGP